MTAYPMIGQRLFNAPLLLRPDKCEIVAAALLDHLGIARLDRIDGTSLGASELRHMAASAMDDGGHARRQSKYYSVRSGVATIPVHQSLVQRVGGLDPYSGMTGYNQIEVKLDAAMQDTEVGAIMLDVDSPGGEVNGCFDLSRKIVRYSARNAGKPIVACVNEQACSAAYALACAADEIYMPETGVAGSIGVWTLLVDMTRAYGDAGMEITMIRAGERKARGAAFEKADKATVEKLISWVETTREQFCQLVAENRAMPIEAIMAQEGDWFFGQQAMDQGLIDGIGDKDAIFNRARILASA